MYRGGEERRVILTGPVGRTIQYKGISVRSERVMFSAPHGPVGCLTGESLEVGSSVRIKAVWQLCSRVSQQDWSGNGNVWGKWLAQGPRWGMLPEHQSACRPPPLYFWRCALCKQLTFKVSARTVCPLEGEIQCFSRMPSLSGHHAIINTEVLDVWTASFMLLIQIKHWAQHWRNPLSLCCSTSRLSPTLNPVRLAAQLKMAGASVWGASGVYVIPEAPLTPS